MNRFVETQRKFEKAARLMLSYGDNKYQVPGMNITLVRRGTPEEKEILEDTSILTSDFEFGGHKFFKCETCSG